MKTFICTSVFRGFRAHVSPSLLFLPFKKLMYIQSFPPPLLRRVLIAWNHNFYSSIQKIKTLPNNTLHGHSIYCDRSSFRLLLGNFHVIYYGIFHHYRDILPLLVTFLVQYLDQSWRQSTVYFTVLITFLSFIVLTTCTSTIYSLEVSSLTSNCHILFLSLYNIFHYLASFTLSPSSIFHRSNSFLLIPLSRSSRVTFRLPPYILTTSYILPYTNYFRPIRFIFYLIIEMFYLFTLFPTD